jgi:UDP-4-amino-4,6-dideoxy-N-acetyl-beta-L-altrosamine transaminase
VIPYSTQDITDGDIAAVVEALTSGWLTQGPAVPRFEGAIARMHRAEHAIAVSNATAALHLGCLALGIDGNSRVWTSPISYVASANCARYCGADVDFVDVEPDTGLMSMDALRRKLVAARGNGSLPSLVIPVAFAGQPCDLAVLRALADEFGFRIMDDASHAVGASFQGEPVGSRFADLTVFSFHPVKIITTAEGGLLLTRDGRLAQALQLLRSHGVTRDPALMHRKNPPAWYYEQQVLGFNYRMTDIQAALGCSQLERLEGMAARRHALASRYDQAFSGSAIQPLRQHPDRTSALHLYVVRLPEARRDTVFAHLRAEGIGVNVHYFPIHLQPYYQALGFKAGDCPKAETFAREVLSLPLYPGLSDEQQDRVIERIKAALQ